MNAPSPRPGLRDEFDRLVSLPREDRDRALRELAARYPALSAQVRALLSHDKGAEEDGFLPVDGDFGSSDDDSTRLVEPYPQGSRLGSYVVDRLVGRGEAGRVYRATLSGEAGPFVAIKVMRTAEKKRSLDGFVAEREHQARLNHANIVRLLDVGAEDSGWPFLVMEYVDGSPLNRHCELQGLGLRERVGLVIEIAWAVDYAHGQGVLHGDLKPRNILVDASGAPKITDFGLARRLGESGSGGPVGLTAGYVPPVIAGEADHRVDGYALGVILYRMATGKEPFQGATPIQVIARAAHRRPPRPRAVCPEIGRGLEAIILKGMRLKGGLGPRELAEALERELGTSRSGPAPG